MDLIEIKNNIKEEDEFVDFYNEIFNKKLDINKSDNVIDITVTLRAKANYIHRDHLKNNKRESEEQATATYVLSEIVGYFITNDNFQLVDIFTKLRNNLDKGICLKY